MTEATPQHTTHQSRNNRNPKNKSRYSNKRKNRGAVKPVRRSSGPVFEYVSQCCGTIARKPRCGQLEAVVNPETKKIKDVPRGLGHFRCNGCGKGCKVNRRKPQPVEVVVATENSVL